LGRKHRGARRPFFGFVDSKRATRNLFAVQGLDGLGGIFFRFKLHEGEPPWTSRNFVEWHDDIDNGSNCTKQLQELLTAHPEAQITSENFA
jgi:hypothetical protein